MDTVKYSTQKCCLLFTLVSLLYIGHTKASDENYVLKDIQVTLEKGNPPQIFTAEEMKQYDGSVSIFIAL